jgi:hypothetical protein
MKNPSIAYSEGEGSNLARYHKQIASSKMDVYYFMPQSESELLALYDSYNSGQIKGGYFSPLEQLWVTVSGVIKEEFTCRCIDGKKSIIDTYLKMFGEFVRITDVFRDQSFLEPIYKQPLCYLGEHLTLFIVNLEGSFIEHSELTRSSTYLPYTVSEIDKILNASSIFRDVKLAEFYRTHYLTDEFRDSSEYQAIYNAIAGTFEEGISLTDLCSKE